MTRSYRPLIRVFRSLEALAAVAVLVSTWVTIEGTFAGYPTWLYLGAVTVPTLVIAPTVLALVVLASWMQSRRNHASESRARQMLATVAALTLLVSTYAVWTLNVSAPGVYWSGFLPLFVGVLLAGGVLLVHTTRVCQQVSIESIRSS